MNNIDDCQIYYKNFLRFTMKLHATWAILSKDTTRWGLLLASVILLPMIFCVQYKQLLFVIDFNLHIISDTTRKFLFTQLLATASIQGWPANRTDLKAGQFGVSTCIFYNFIQFHFFPQVAVYI